MARKKKSEEGTEPSTVAGTEAEQSTDPATKTTRAKRSVPNPNNDEPKTPKKRGRPKKAVDADDAAGTSASDVDSTDVNFDIDDSQLDAMMRSMSLDMEGGMGMPADLDSYLKNITMYGGNTPTDEDLQKALQEMGLQDFKSDEDFERYLRQQGDGLDLSKVNLDAIPEDVDFETLSPVDADSESDEVKTPEYWRGGKKVYDEDQEEDDEDEDEDEDDEDADDVEADVEEDDIFVDAVDEALEEEEEEDEMSDGASDRSFYAPDDEVLYDVGEDVGENVTLVEEKEEVYETIDAPTSDFEEDAFKKWQERLAAAPVKNKPKIQPQVAGEATELISSWYGSDMHDAVAKLGSSELQDYQITTITNMPQYWQQSEFQWTDSPTTYTKSKKGRRKLKISIPERPAELSPNIYLGGKPNTTANNISNPLEPNPVRATVIALTGNNSTMVKLVNAIFEKIDSVFGDKVMLVHRVINDDDVSGLLQVWLECFNSYSLVDGPQLQFFEGAIREDNVLQPSRIADILQKIEDALEEERLGGSSLTDREYGLRLKGGRKLL